jgi:hypothetical protein
MKGFIFKKLRKEQKCKSNFLNFLAVTEEEEELHNKVGLGQK